MPIDLALTLTTRDESTLVTVTGKLDLPGYAVLRDGLLKAAADTPPGLVADVNALVTTEMSPAAVLSLVAKRITDRPGIPFSVVTHQPAHLQALHERGTDLYVPVHPDVLAAERHQRTPVRRRTERTIRHTASPAYLRLELRRGMLTIAVADDDPLPAVLLERHHMRDPGLGLYTIAHAARAWGSSPRWSGGKTVWAVLTTEERSSG